MNLDGRPPHLLEHLLQNGLVEAEVNIALVLLEQLDALQGVFELGSGRGRRATYNVLFLHEDGVGNLVDGELALLLLREGEEVLDQPLGPVGHVQLAAHVAEGRLGRPDAVLDGSEFVGEVDYELAVALLLVEGQHQDAVEVVVLLVEVLILREVAHDVVAELVVLGQHVEEEGVRVVLHELVVQEELGQVGQVLAVGLVDLPVDLEHRVLALVVLVDEVPRRAHHLALLHVPHQAVRVQVEVQAELAEVQRPVVVVALGEERVVPRGRLVLPHH